jgi:hypothetical protein
LDNGSVFFRPEPEGTPVIWTGTGNRRYLINEKGAAAAVVALGNLAERASSVLQAIRLRAFDAALVELRSTERELARLTTAAR